MQGISRREFVLTGLASTAGLVLAACGGREEDASISRLDYPTATPSDTTAVLVPTPQCDDHDETPSQTAGPFYTPDTPQRTNLREAGMVGTPLVVTGRVLAADCTPIPNAVIDFWHADDAGNYDNEGYLLRGHQYSDANGNYRLETIMPGLYPGRTRHIHVKMQAEGSRLLTTQLYFPDEPENSRDGIFDSALLVEMVADGEEKMAAFNFVL